MPLIALGSGLVGETQTGEKLVEMLAAPSVDQNMSACMALVAIGSKESLEVVTHVITSGDEKLARLAAEAFAAKPELSSEFFRNSLNSNNVITRYAVVCALGKINDKWVNSLLGKLSTEDPQWMVRNTALNLSEYRQKGSPFIPKPLTPIESADWANALATRLNVTVMPGELSKDFLMKAIQQGSAEERQAVLDYLRVLPAPDNKVIQSITTIVEKEMRPLQDAGAYALWFLSMAGMLSG
jgi:HEAT repeat protein